MLSKLLVTFGDVISIIVADKRSLPHLIGPQGRETPRNAEISGSIACSANRSICTQVLGVQVRINEKLICTCMITKRGHDFTDSIAGTRVHPARIYYACFGTTGGTNTSSFNKSQNSPRQLAVRFAEMRCSFIVARRLQNLLLCSL